MGDIIFCNRGRVKKSPMCIAMICAEMSSEAEAKEENFAFLEVR